MRLASAAVRSLFFLRIVYLVGLALVSFGF